MALWISVKAHKLGTLHCIFVNLLLSLLETVFESAREMDCGMEVILYVNVRMYNAHTHTHTLIVLFSLVVTASKPFLLYCSWWWHQLGSTTN